MKRTYIFTILLGMISTHMFSQVGINTNSPTRTLDINGEMRVRSLPTTNITNDKNLMSVDPNGNINITSNTSGSIGDVKHGLETADHNGWYLMNGRAVSMLPSTAQTSAGTLGIISSLPDMTDRMIRTQTSETVGSLGGANLNTLSQANMPAYTTVSKSTTQNGNHAHGFADLYEGVAAFSYQPGFSYAHNLFANQRTTGAAGNHTHTVTAPTGGSGQPLNVVPEFVAVNTFIYLGY